MSRLEPSILVRRLVDEDQTFVSLGESAKGVLNQLGVVHLEYRDGCFHLTQAEIDAIAKSFGAPAGATRRKQPSLVQPMQQQPSSASAQVREQAMAQSDHQAMPAKGEFGGLCGHETCICENARFEYIDPRAEKRAFGKFYCEWCANDKNRQALTFRSDRDYSPACVERTVAPPKVEKTADQTPTDDDRYWNLA